MINHIHVYYNVYIHRIHCTCTLQCKYVVVYCNVLYAGGQKGCYQVGRLVTYKVGWLFIKSWLVPFQVGLFPIKLACSLSSWLVPYQVGWLVTYQVSWLPIKLVGYLSSWLVPYQVDWLPIKLVG